MPRFDQRSARCRVFTYKEGLLSAVAHDLEIDVTRFEIDTDEAARTVAARFDATSLRVLATSLLSAHDRATIERNIVDEVLHARRFPEIRFTARATSAHRLDGTLALAGRERALAVTLRSDGEAEATLHQPDFGIKPYSAMLGTLRIKPDVQIRVTLTPGKAR